MQRGLIDHRSCEKRITVVFQRDGQASKPVCPLITQMTLNPDLVDHEVPWIRAWVEFVRHFLVLVVARHNRLGHLLNVRIIYLHHSVAV